MNTFERIKRDALEARKARDTIRANVLGTLVAELCRNTKEPSEKEVDKGVEKFLASIEKTLEIQPDAKLEKEKLIIEPYRPVKVEVVVDEKNILIMLNQVGEANPDKELSEKTIGWFVGQIMRASNGQLPAAAVKSYLEDKVHKNNFVDAEAKAQLGLARVSTNLGKY